MPPELNPSKRENSISDLSLVAISQVTMQNTISQTVVNPDYIWIFKKSAPNLINFIYLNHRVKELTKELVGHLEKKAQGSVILDFGQQADVNTFLNRVYEEALKSLEGGYQHQIHEGNKLCVKILEIQNHYKSQNLNEVILLELEQFSRELTELLTFVMINNEILQIIFEKHCDIFERKSWQGLLKMDEATDGKFKRILFHPALMNFHYLLEFIVKNYHVNVVSSPQHSKSKAEINENADAEPLNSSALKDQEEPQALIVQKIQKQLNQQDSLIDHHQAWLLENMGFSPNEYDNISYYEKRSSQLWSMNISSQQLFEEVSQRPTEEESDKKKIILYATHNLLDLWIILLHTFLFIMNIYGLSMTSYLYAAALNLNTSISGVIQAANPIASTIFGFYLNWVTKYKKYYWSHIGVELLMIIGNILYFVPAFYVGNNNLIGIVILVISRVIIGVGGARLLTRKYIAVNVQPWALSKYSAVFVGVTASAICIGPGISSLLLFYPGGSKIGSIPLTQYNIFAFVFIFVWTINFIFGAIFFVGENKNEAIEARKKLENKTKIIRFFKDMKQEQFQDLFYINNNDVQEFKNPRLPDFSTDLKIVGAQNVQNEAKINQNEGIDYNKLVSHPRPVMETEEIRKRDAQKKIVSSENEMGRKPNEQMKLVHREEGKNSQFENLNNYVTKIPNSDTQLAAGVRIVHPFRWTFFSALVLFFVKVSLLDRR